MPIQTQFPTTFVGPIYLLGPFRFTTAQSAPLTSPYTEAGATGSLTINDPSGVISVSGGALTTIGASSVIYGAYATIGVTRVAGRAFLVKLRWSALGQRYSAFLIGRASAIWGAGYSNIAHGWADYGGLNSLVPISNGDYALGSGNVGIVPATGIDYDMLIVLRSSGAFYFLKGGAISNWTLFWVDTRDSTATLYAQIGFYGTSSLSADNLRIINFDGMWTTDNGIATSVNLTTPRNTTLTSAMTADALLDWIGEWHSGQARYLYFRMLTVNDCWLVKIEGDGTLNLYEIVGGGYTLRGTTASDVVSGTNPRIVIVCAGTTIAVYVNNVYKILYSIATTQQTSTNVRFESTSGGGVADIICWPRTVSLPAGV